MLGENLKLPSGAHEALGVFPKCLQVAVTWLHLRQQQQPLCALCLLLHGGEDGAVP